MSKDSIDINGIFGDAYTPSNEPTKDSTSRMVETAGQFCAQVFPTISEARCRELFHAIKAMWFDDALASTTLIRARTELAKTDDERQYCVHIVTAFIFK